MFLTCEGWSLLLVELSASIDGILVVFCKESHLHDCGVFVHVYACMCMSMCVQNMQIHTQKGSFSQVPENQGAF